MSRFTFLKDSDLAPKAIWGWAKKLVTDLNNLEKAVGGSGTVPTGAQMFWLGAEAPLGWLICDGGQYTVADYSSLFLQIGYTYGGANDVFNVPDMRDRLLMGAGTTVALGELAGGLTATLGVPNLPAHSHPLTDPGHNHTITDPGHAHSGGVANAGTASVAASGGPTTPANTGVATTGITVNARATGITIGNTGAGDPFSVLNPVLGTHVIIKY